MNKRDEKNIVILQYFKEGLLTEQETFKFLDLQQKTDKAKHKYIRRLIKEIAHRDLNKHILERTKFDAITQETIPNTQDHFNTFSTFTGGEDQ
jgi:hypothetical protein